MKYFLTKTKRTTFLQDQNLKISLALGIGVGLICLAFLPPAIYSIDGNSMLAVAESLVTKHSFSVPPFLGVPGRGGYYYSVWYPLLSILSVPFVAVGLAIGHLFNLPSHYVAAICALVLPALLTAATTSLVALLALRLESTKEGACLAALGYALGTIALVYARTFFAEPLLAFLTVASLYLALGETKQKIIGSSVLAGLAVLAKPTGIMVGPILSGYLLAKRRPFHVVLLPLAGTGIGAILYGGYNYARFGNPLSLKGESLPPEITALLIPKISVLPEGFFGLLFSPGCGLIWYCPPVLLSIIGFRTVVRSNAFEALTVVTLFLGYLVFHSVFIFWYGGESWGPRFLLPALPGLMALAGVTTKVWKKWLLVLIIIGFIINAPTLVSFYERYYSEASEQGISEAALLWSPTHAPLVHMWGAAYHEISDAYKSDVKGLIKEVGNPSTRIANSRMLRVVALWWWMLPAAGISRWVGAVLSLLLMGVGVWVIVGGRKNSYLTTKGNIDKTTVK